jgi:6-phosphogluconolactonase
MAKIEVFVGSYTTDLGWVQGKGLGIGSYQLDTETGALSLLSTMRTDNPSFLALHPSGNYLYANNEASHRVDSSDDSISAFAIAADGTLSLINQQASHGKAPCFVSVDPEGDFAYLANFIGGNSVVYPIAPNGGLECDSDRISPVDSGTDQPIPHAHTIKASPSGRYLLACDLGLDKIFIHQLDRRTAKLNRHGELLVPRGSGPRHIAFHPSGRFVYLISQDAGTITAFAWDDDLGVLTDLQTASTVPADFSGEPAASEIQVHPEGQWLYASNRGHNSVVIFRIDAASGLLSLVGFQASLGITPRNFTLTPSGDMLLVANQDSDQIVVFRLDAATGLLSELDRHAVPTPVCMVCRPRSTRPRIAPG